MQLKLLIHCFLLSTAECGSHSLVFMSTGRVQPGGRPSFEQLTVFDGVPISHCDSSSWTEQLKPELESKNLPGNCQEAGYNVLESLHQIPALINITVYVVQRRRGCIQSASGTVSVFEAWAVNGMDFISFDPESQSWTSQSPSATTVKQLWNSMKAMNSAYRQFIRGQCPQMMERIQLRTINPNTELSVFAKPVPNTAQALLRCHVMSTDRSVSSVYLTGDGASKANWITVTGPLPSEDGSVILRLTAGISLNQDTYSCTVQTGGHNITVSWDGNSLDGRHLLIRTSLYWKMLTIILGFICMGFMVTISFCATMSLIKCVKKKHHPLPSSDLQLVEQCPG
ncbi:hereditary hemochromatosis protein homolog [Toxotes jaculatrix]|uniref:hereditary hemochromatosis protein homolog n=1 Tax=Toxotes jaculatrix TaxID=941984 RepID=UPI001B3A7BDA|nr:hereditary hemochromatosis protein homolog [Toxotes jaculatrix]